MLWYGLVEPRYSGTLEDPYLSVTLVRGCWVLVFTDQYQYVQYVYKQEAFISHQNSFAWVFVNIPTS